MNKNIIIERIEDIYGEDVADLVYELYRLNQKYKNIFLYVNFDNNILQIYFGDQNLKDSFIIFKEEPTKVNVFSNERNFEIVVLYELLKAYRDK